MIKFILNEKELSTDLSPGYLLLDFIRYQKNLTGTKIGCREGDCGACTVLIGDIVDGKLRYHSMTSCLLPLGNVHHKHVVTVEGTNLQTLNAAQRCMSDEGATQCGFCTPGFVVSLSGFCLNSGDHTFEKAIAAIDGNICRCTGYKSIERAAAKLSAIMLQKKEGEHIIDYVTQQQILPEYFKGVKNRLETLQSSSNGALQRQDGKFLGGGTDLYVQQPEKMTHADIQFLFDERKLKGIKIEGNKCIIGASATVTDIAQSPVFHDHFPKIAEIIKLISSTQIRNMATLSGNFVNASPIGDFTIIFLALNAQLNLRNGSESRTIPLRNFYKGYKDLDKLPEEYIESIEFDLPSQNTHFNFEKVSKRTHLDIASVNTAFSIETNENTIISASLSAGGIGPVPTFLSKSAAFLENKTVSIELIKELIKIVKEEITPMSDARGTKEYKTLLLGQLVKAHFITLFPSINSEQLMTI